MARVILLSQTEISTVSHTTDSGPDTSVFRNKENLFFLVIIIQGSGNITGILYRFRRMSDMAQSIVCYWS